MISTHANSELRPWGDTDPGSIAVSGPKPLPGELSGLSSILVQYLSRSLEPITRQTGISLCWRIDTQLSELPETALARMLAALPEGIREAVQELAPVAGNHTLTVSLCKEAIWAPAIRVLVHAAPETGNGIVLPAESQEVLPGDCWKPQLRLAGEGGRGLTGSGAPYLWFELPIAGSIPQTGTQPLLAVDGALFSSEVLDDLASMLTRAELQEYLDLLHPTVRRRIQGLRVQSEMLDWPNLLHSAHALAGVASCYGLLALSASARELEQSCRNQDCHGLARQLEQTLALIEPSLSQINIWKRGALAPDPAG